MPHDYDFLAPFWIVQAQNQGQASSPTNLITRIVFFPKNIPTLKYIPKPPIAPRHFQNQAPSLSICGGWAGPHWCSASAACSLHAEEREACWQHPPCPQQLPWCRGQAKHSQQLHCCEPRLLSLWDICNFNIMAKQSVFRRKNPLKTSFLSHLSLASPPCCT